jgi:hypothetical protein
MAGIKDQLARSAAIRADARQREKEAEEETARSHLRLNNLEIALRNVQHDTERKLKRARSPCERESEPAAKKQQQERRNKRRMPPPPNPLETTGQVDGTAPSTPLESGRTHMRDQVPPVNDTRANRIGHQS